MSFPGYQRKMNTTVMLTYYDEEQSGNNNSTENVTTTPTYQSEPDLAAMDRAYNPALIHHLYLGLGHMGKVHTFPLSLSFHILKKTFLFAESRISDKYHLVLHIHPGRGDVDDHPLDSDGLRILLQQRGEPHI